MVTLLDIPAGSRRPYSYEGERQWEIDVNNCGLEFVRQRERETEKALLEHEALTDFDVADLTTVEDFPDHTSNCHGCMVIHLTTVHADKEKYQNHRLSCNQRPCNPGVDVTKLPYQNDPPQPTKKVWLTGFLIGISTGSVTTFLTLLIT